MEAWAYVRQSNKIYNCERTRYKGKNKKVVGLMKEELGGKVMTEFAALKPQTDSYLMDDVRNDKKAKGTNKCVIKRRLKFNDYYFDSYTNETKTEQNLK